MFSYKILTRQHHKRLNIKEEQYVSLSSALILINLFHFIAYMSPEVVLMQDMGRPMDIWAIGCVVVEMFTSKVRISLSFRAIQPSIL